MQAVQDTIQEIISILLGLRKFMVMGMLVIIAVVFRIYNYLDGSQFVELLKSTTLAFFATNSVEHVKNMVSTYMDSKTGKEVKETETEIGDK